MSEVHNPAVDTLSALFDHPPINTSANPIVKKPKKRTANNLWKKKKSKQPTVPKPRKPQFGDVDTLSEAYVLQRVNRISVCRCGGHRVCKTCVTKYDVVLPQTYGYGDTDPDVGSDDDGYDQYAKYRLEAQAVVTEYCCKRNFDNDTDFNTCCENGVGPLPCTLCLQFDDNGPTKEPWTYGEDLGFILNETGVCPGCMVEHPEEVCRVCLHDNRGWD